MLRSVADQQLVKRECGCGLAALGRGALHGAEPGLEIAHEAIDQLLMLGLTNAGQVRIDGSNGRTLMAEVDLDLAQVLSLLQKMSRIGMAQRMNVGVLFDSALAQGQSEGALEGGAAHWLGGRGRALAIMPLAWEKPHRAAGSFPVGAQTFQGPRRQGPLTIPITVAVAT